MEERDVEAVDVHKKIEEGLCDHLLKIALREIDIDVETKLAEPALAKIDLCLSERLAIFMPVEEGSDGPIKAAAGHIEEGALSANPGVFSERAFDHRLGADLPLKRWEWKLDEWP